MTAKSKKPAKVVEMPYKPRRRQWQAAKTDRLTSAWQAKPRAVDTDLRYALEALVARSREAAQNNDHAKHFLRLVKSNVIGSDGFTFQAKIKRRNGKPDKAANEALEEGWREWGRRGVCDVSGRYSWVDLQRMAVESLARDGELLVRKVVNWGNDHGFALQILDAQLLDVRYNDDDKNIRMGVEMDRFRRPTFYHLLDEKPLQGYGGEHKREPIPADEIYHLFLPEWAFQTRGIPWMSTSLWRLHQMGEYENAEVVAARLGAEQIGHYKRDLDAADNPGATDVDGENQFIQDVEKGEYGVIPPGWDFQLDDPKHPNAVYPDFIKAGMRSVSSGLGVNYNTLANDLEGVNYTSLRHGNLVDRDLWMMLQKWFSDAFVDQVYRDWLFPALAKGALSPLTTARLDGLHRVRHQGRRWQAVDPVKDAQANTLAVNQRTKSISSIIREQGDDPDEVWEEIARDNARLEELGIQVANDSETLPEAEEEESQEKPTEGKSSRAVETREEMPAVVPAPVVNVTMPDINITNEVPVPDVEVKNEVPVPDVTVVNESPAVKAPDVIVENTVEQAAIPAPVVTVTNNVPVPDVTVENKVDVEVPRVDRKVTFNRDRNGQITEADIEDE